MPIAAPPLSVASKISYGIGQAADGVKIGAFNVFAFFYYTQVLGLPTSYTGIAVGISLFFDAVTDPLIGSLSDNWKGRLGRRHPFLYAAPIPLGLFLVALFSPPALPEFALFLWLTVFAVLTRIAMTFYYVPHVSLGAELSEDFGERTAIVAYRFFFGYIGQMATYFIGFTLIFTDALGGQFYKEGYLPFGVILAVIMAAAIVTSAVGTQNRIPFLPKAQVRSHAAGAWALCLRTFAEVRDALTNYSFRWIFAGILVVYMMVGVDTALNLHMNTYFWELESRGNLFFFLATPVGALIGVLFARRLNERFDKRPSLLFGAVSWSVCQILPVVLRLLDWFPENGTSALLWTLIVIKFLQGLGVVQALVTLSSMIADIVDDHELTTGRRQEGIFFSAVSFSNKVTSGVGTMVAGFALTLISWPTGPAIKTAADVPPDTLMWLGLIYGPIVAGFAVVSVYCLSKYNLTRARHAEIIVELHAARRLREAQPPF
ncbi:MAG: MFS transporter [Gammaproteobacteria bacterium]|nr:MFS transporter [Gammaproteobacteria bacterium]